MMRQPTLFMTVGLPCTGKTTAARRIEIEHDALRLTKDEWVKALYGHENPPSAQEVIEGRLIRIGLRALELGTNVVIDYGLWSRDERSALRQAAADRGAIVEMRYFELAPAEQRRRLDLRQAEAPHTTWPMSDEELAEWAATSRSQRRPNSTAVNLSTIRRPDSPPGTGGAGSAGRPRSPDALVFSIPEGWAFDQTQRLEHELPGLLAHSGKRRRIRGPLQGCLPRGHVDDRDPAELLGLRVRAAVTVPSPATMTDPRPRPARRRT